MFGKGHDGCVHCKRLGQLDTSSRSKNHSIGGMMHCFLGLTLFICVSVAHLLTNAHYSLLSRPWGIKSGVNAPLFFIQNGFDTDWWFINYAMWLASCWRSSQPEENVLFCTILSHSRTLIMPKRKKTSKTSSAFQMILHPKNQTVALRKWKDFRHIEILENLFEFHVEQFWPLTLQCEHGIL